MQARFTYKIVTELEPLSDIVELQKSVWGEEVVTSAPQMVAAIHNGGIVIGAFDNESHRLVGFCYGFAGYSQLSKKPYLCSHMMAIHPDYRNQGIGEHLKLKQREWAIGYGYEKIIWTFDPLEVKNGYLNLSKLGGYVKTYIEAYYGYMNDKLNKDTPSDRFLVEWDLLSEKVNYALRGNRNQARWKKYEKLFDIRFDGKHPIPCEDKSVEYYISGYLLPIPKEVQQMKKDAPDLVQEWRLHTRNKLNEALLNGYHVTGVIPEDDIAYYVLERSDPPA
ncbi:GNAT family N-acetyltransferase [Fictibacillus terranigra]|uniref:GNAT family N-acetyltransferase n=1 Tax=Fictibacillus terranigra TaxID=3058424 RepID=A0ABT8EBM0_9BACL|nr:GNAT family N-acetyltransferase [Fictibacillus sp. CENA-BCM004]MDN4075328.1 GNAT family N-acetyltransferase [Fictibacillus sp. CENA-BCM004]